MTGSFKVKEKIIGDFRTFIVAEIGSNHNQSLALAYQSIDAAVECGADAVKFQSINVNQIYYEPSKQTQSLHKRIDFDEKWHWILKDYCDKKGIIFFSSPTYLKAVDILEDINVPLYKLASAQIGTYPQLVEKVVSTGKPVILSTGIVTKSELKKVLLTFKRYNNKNLAILHCNSIYPTPFESVFLPVMTDIKNEFGCVVGFSDHTPDIYVPIAAVAMGAKIIEKHFTIDKNLLVPDAPFSLIPEEFKRMVEGIRAVEKTLLKNPRDVIQYEERQFKDAIRTRLVSKIKLTKGDKIKTEHFKFRRYHKGVDCRDLNNLINRKAVYVRDIDENDIICKNDLRVGVEE